MDDLEFTITEYINGLELNHEYKIDDIYEKIQNENTGSINYDNYLSKLKEIFKSSKLITIDENMKTLKRIDNSIIKDENNNSNHEIKRYIDRQNIINERNRSKVKKVNKSIKKIKKKMKKLDNYDYELIEINKHCKQLINEFMDIHEEKIINLKKEYVLAFEDMNNKYTHVFHLQRNNKDDMKKMIINNNCCIMSLLLFILWLIFILFVLIVLVYVYIGIKWDIFQ